jgi:hypothetical protein
MSPAPNPHPQSSKSASSAQSEAKNQASAPEPSSPAEPMTDQPNSLLATPPTRKIKDTASTDQTAQVEDAEQEPPKPTAEEPTDSEEPDSIDMNANADGANTANAESDAESIAVPSEPELSTTAASSLSDLSEPPSQAEETTAPSTGSTPSTSAPSTSTPESVDAESAPSVAEEAVEAAVETAPTEVHSEPAAPPALPRHQPIPPASEPMQYRAIGLVRGKYMPSEEQFTRGFILTEDEVLIDSVLLGRVMSLVKKHIDLEQSHLWVVYPRTRERDLELHMQIVGVWEPEKLNRTANLEENEDTSEASETTLDEAALEESAADSESEEIFAPEGSNGSASTEDLNDRYFSVRGEIVYQAEEEQRLLVKIRRAPKPGETEGKAFKVALKGTLEGKALGYFWDLQVQRENNELVVTEATQIGMVPPQKRSAGGRGRPPRRGAGGPPRRGGPGAGGPPRKRWQGSRDEDHRPARSDRGERPERSERPSAPSTPRQPISKPVKRRPKSEES